MRVYDYQPKLISFTQGTMNISIYVTLVVCGCPELHCAPQYTVRCVDANSKISPVFILDGSVR